MASRNDYSQNRKLYVGTVAEVTVTDGNAIIAGNVGIGTTSPGEKLTVHSTATAIQTLYTTNSQGGFTGYQNSTGGVKGFVGYGPTLFTGLDINNFGLRSQSGMPFATGGGNIRMYINSSGNVGIGTTSPTDKLAVNGNLSIFGNKIYNGSASNSAGVSFPGSTTRIDGYNGITFHSSTTTVGSQSERMRITNTGNVGIGTTSPSYKLTVESDVPYGGILIEGNNAPGLSIIDHSSTSESKIYVQSTASSSGNLRISADNNNTATTPTIEFKIGGSEKMRITDGGNVGIGTESPDSRLDINAGVSAITSGPAVRISKGASPVGLIRYDTLVIEANDVPTIRLGESDGTVSSIMSGDSNLRINSTHPIKFYTNGTATGEAHAGQGGTFAMIIDNSQNVGIGTTNPATRLHVFKENTTSRTTTTDLISLGSSHQSVGYNGFGTAIVDYRRTYQHSNPHVINRIKFIERGDSGNDWGGAIQFETKTLSSGTAAPVTRMSIDYNGNVGIGTTNATRKLQVDAGSEYALSLNSTQQYLMEFARGGVSEWWFAVNNGDFKFHENGVGDQVIIKAGGNVGIGTTNPTEKLEVSGKVYIEGSGQDWNETTPGVTRGSIHFDPGTATDHAGNAITFGASDISSGTNAQAGIYTRSDGTYGTKMYFATTNSYSSGSKTAMMIDYNSNVGIGTTSPLNKTHIIGPTLTTGTETSYGLAISDVGDQTKTLILGYDLANDVGIIQAIDQQTAWKNLAFAVSGDTKIGVGELAPSAKLHIKSPGNTTLIRAYSAGYKAMDLWGATNGSQLTLHGGTNAATIVLDGRPGYNSYFSTGSVGIGETGPGAKLHIKGAGSSPNSQTDVMAIIQNSTYGSTNTSGENKLIFGWSNHYAAAISAYKDGAVNRTGLKFYTEVGYNVPVEAMRITSAGNVGIGTTSPGAKLEVSDGSSGFTGNYNARTAAVFEGSNSAGTTLSIMSPDTGYSGIFFGNNTLETYGQLAFDHTSNSFKFINGGGTERMRITSAGNVGIGTTSPGGKLQVNQTNNDIYQLTLHNTHLSTTAKTRIGNWVDQVKISSNYMQSGGTKTQDNTAKASWVQTMGDDVFDISRSPAGSTTLSSLMTINSSGNVGIGTTNPDYKLEVDGTLGVSRTDGIIFAGSTANGNKITVDTSNDFIFSTSLNSAPYTVTERMRIANNGATTFTSTVTATNFILSSDERLKENIEEVCDNRIKADWKTFELKTEKGQKRYGVIAQELEKTNPEFVREDTQGFKSVAYIDLLIAKIAELEARLEKAGI